MEIRNRWKIFVLLILLVILISGCVDNENVVPTVEEMDNEAEGTAQNLAEPDSAETKEIWEKGYSLPLEQAIKDEAEADCKKEMEKIKNVYIEADKGEATNPILEEEALSQMCTVLRETGCPVTAAGLYYRMENYDKMDTFLTDCESGKEGKLILYQMTRGGGINRSQFIFDGNEMYVIDTVSAWNEENVPYVTGTSYTRLKEWKYTEKGWFAYEYCVPQYPEVTEVVNGNYMLRVKPMLEEYIDIAEKYLIPVGYQGNNLFRSDWDAQHLENLDYAGLYEYLYLLKYQEAFGPQRNCDGIPKEEFENLMTEYLPVTAEELAKYAAFDEETQSYIWKRLGPLTHVATNFSASIPEVTEITENLDGTITVFIDVVCEPRGEDTLFRHALTLQIQENGAVRYLSNRILDEGTENLLEYRYRLMR